MTLEDYILCLILYGCETRSVVLSEECKFCMKLTKPYVNDQAKHVVLPMVMGHAANKLYIYKFKKWMIGRVVYCNICTGWFFVYPKFYTVCVSVDSEVQVVIVVVIFHCCFEFQVLANSVHVSGDFSF